jgi:hypothetical protein
MTVPEIVAALQQQRITGSAAFRRLVAFGDWMVPVSERAFGEMLDNPQRVTVQIHETDDGQRRLLVFSSAESFQAYRNTAALTGEQHFLNVSGRWLFRQLASVDALLIDPGNPAHLALEGPLLESLDATAHALDVEQRLLALHQGRAGQDDLPVCAHYPHYLMAVIEADDGALRLALAPDAQNRPLAALFTTPDAFDAFASHDAPPGLRALEGDLFKFCHRVSRLPAAGLVFNCAGPTQPIGFQRTFCDLVLDLLPPA